MIFFNIQGKRKKKIQQPAKAKRKAKESTIGSREAPIHIPDDAPTYSINKQGRCIKHTKRVRNIIIPLKMKKIYASYLNIHLYIYF